jgi:hypothetical protein
MSWGGRLGGLFSGRRSRGPMPPGRLLALFVMFLALLIYQRDYILLALAGLGLIVYGILTRRRD